MEILFYLFIPKIVFDNHQVELTYCVRFSTVYIDNKLSWNKQINDQPRSTKLRGVSFQIYI